MNDLAASAPQAGVSPVIWLLIVIVVIVLMVKVLRRAWGAPAGQRPFSAERPSFPSVKACDAVRVCQLIDEFEASPTIEGTETPARGLALISNSAGWDDSRSIWIWFAAWSEQAASLGTPLTAVKIAEFTQTYHERVLPAAGTAGLFLGHATDGQRAAIENAAFAACFDLDPSTSVRADMDLPVQLFHEYLGRQTGRLFDIKKSLSARSHESPGSSGISNHGAGEEWDLPGGRRQPDPRKESANGRDSRHESPAAVTSALSPAASAPAAPGENESAGTEFVVGESVFIDESLSEYEALRVFFQVADERGHGSPSVVVDDRGQAITHPDYIDRMGAPHIKAGAWAFCRRPAAEALGLPSGTDWVRAHCPQLMFSAGSPYRNMPHFYDELYIQQFGSAEPQLMIPMSSAHPVAWSNDGSRICVLEERLGRLTDGTRMAKYLLWEYELALGHRRLVAGFPAADRLDSVELSYSLDSRWIHICEWASGRNLLVRVQDGLVVRLPVVSSAVAWNRGYGPDLMTVMTPDRESGNLIAYDYDVSSDKLSRRAEIRSPNGLPLEVRELSMSADGLALVTAPVGSPGVEQLQRGGVYAAAVIDLDDGIIEPALPVRYRTPAAQRRHHSPRWCEDWTIHTPQRTTVADHLIQSATMPDCEPDAPSIRHDQLQQWFEILQGFDSAWLARALPADRFADDFTQFVMSCGEIDTTATDEVLSPLRQRAEREPVARAMLRRISGGYRMGSPVAALAFPDGRDVASADYEHSQRALPSPSEAPVETALVQLVAAEDRHQASGAVQQVLCEARRAGKSAGQTWDWIASLTSEALARGNHPFAAKAGLAAVLWNGFFLPNDPQLADLGLGPASPTAELALLLSSFEACTHLPERMILGRDSNAAYDVETTRNWCQQGMSRLPLAEYLTAVARPARRAAVPSALGDPSTKRHNEAEGPRMSKKKIFVSYVREDSALVGRIADTLRNHGAEAWLDRTHITPGDRWQRAIRHAIRDGAYFLACFSPSYAQRDHTYMNEELRLAIQQIRLIPLNRRWFIPIILKPCQIPDFPIDAVETLENLQYIDFSHDWDAAMTQLIKAISPDPWP
jgi:TIR domain